MLTLFETLHELEELAEEYGQYELTHDLSRIKISARYLPESKWHLHWDLLRELIEKQSEPIKGVLMDVVDREYLESAPQILQ